MDRATTRRLAVLPILLAFLVSACGTRPTATPPATPQAVVAAPVSTATAAAEPTATSTLAPPGTPAATPTATYAVRSSATAATAPTTTPEPEITVPSTPAALPAAIELANRVDVERLMADVAWLADDARRGRMNGTPAEDEVGAWLADRFRTLGLGPFIEAGLADYTLSFPAAGFSGGATPTAVPPGGSPVTAEDILAVLPGTTRPDEYVFIGAHYDHVGVSPGGQVNNGADDNASGTAAVLEAARLLSRYDVRPQRSVVFVAFSAEEVGLLGAAALCTQLQGAQLAGQSRVLNLDVIAPPEGVDQSVHAWYGAGAQVQGPLVDAVVQSGRELDVAVVARGDDLGTDARAFWACGVPAVSVTTGGQRSDHPYIHTPGDDPEQIDVEAYHDAVRVAIAAVWLLANPE